MKTNNSFNAGVSSTLSASRGAAASAPKTKVQKVLINGRLRQLIVGVALAAIAAAPARSTVLFRPIGRPPEVFAFNNVTMTQPLTNNPYALNSPKVYLIFVGPNWAQNGNPTAAVNSMISAAKAILGSSYLSGLTQYGSDGHAAFGGFTIDTSLDPLTWSNTNPDGTPNKNPMFFETNQILSNPFFSSWLPPPGDARTSPIYVVARYSQNGTGAGFGGGGSNGNGPNGFTTRAVNVIDVSIPTADQVDGFTWVLSHELVERMSSGIGGLSEVSPDSGGQIADGEPEGNNLYARRLWGSFGPVVTSYWSVLDQDFIIPDGLPNRVLLVPIWNGAAWTGRFVSLQQGSLYQLYGFDQQTLIDNQVQSFAVNLSGGTAQLFDLTANGQVRQYSGSGTTWTALTGANTVASSLAGTSYLSPTGNNTYTLMDGALYMLAANKGQPNKVWQYTGSGTNWTAVTGPNTTVSSIAAAGGGMYMVAYNNLGHQVWQYSGFLSSWSALTGTNTYVDSIAGVGNSLYMLADNNGQRNQVWLYSGSGNWTALTGTNTTVYGIAAAGDVLCIVGMNDGDTTTYIWQLIPLNWIPLTGANTRPNQLLVQDGATLYMGAANNNLPLQAWQYAGPGNWTALTGLNTNIHSLSVGTDNRLYMTAANNGGPIQNWIYNGTPGNWSVK